MIKGIKRISFKGFSLIIPNAYRNKEVISYSEMKDNYFLSAFTRNDRKSILSIVFAVSNTQKLPIQLTEMFGTTTNIQILEEEKGTMLVKSLDEIKYGIRSYTTFIMHPAGIDINKTRYLYVLTAMTQTKGWPSLAEVLPVFASLEVPKVKIKVR